MLDFIHFTLCLPLFVSALIATPVEVQRYDKAILKINEKTVDNNRDVDTSDRPGDFYQHNSSTPSTKQKRVGLFRPVDSCPTGSSFKQSNCLYSGTRGHLTACEKRTHFLFGKCGENELCVDNRKTSPFPLNSHPLAWCVSIVDIANYYVHRQPDGTQIDVPASQVGLPTSGSTSGYTLETLVTSTDSLQSINASMLAVTAQKSQMVNGHQLWQTLPDGRVQCEDCATIGIASVPEGTERFSVDLKLPEAVNRGVVHLPLWAPGNS